MKPSLNNLLTAVGLCLVFALAAAVRIECARDELWIDEYITAWTVADTWPEAVERARISHQGGLYTGLMFVVTHAFGMTAASLRGPSLVSGFLIVASSAWLGWQLTKLRSVAILAAYLAAVDPNFVFYASEARPYAIVQLLGLGSAVCVLTWRRRIALPKNVNGNRLEKQARFPLAVWIGTVVAMFYFHFTSVFAIASQVICGWIIALRLGNGKTQWLAAAVTIVVFAIPGLVALLAIYPRADEWRAFSSLAGLLHSLQFAGLMYFLPAIVGLACAAAKRRVRRSADWIGVLLLMWIALFTIAAVALVTGQGIAPLGHYRYAIAATGLGPTIGASYLVAWRRGWTRGIAAVALAIAAWSQTSIGWDLYQGTLQAPMRWERWSQVALQINAQSQSRLLPVIVFPNLIEDSRITADQLGKNQSYFWAPLAVLNPIDSRCQVFALPTWSDNRFDDSSLEAILRSGGVWLVIRGGLEFEHPQDRSLAASIVDELRTKLKDQGVELTQRSFGPAQSDVQLFRVLVEPPR